MSSKAISVRVKAATKKSFSGFRSHDLRTGRIPDYVDQDCTHLNRILIEPPSAAAMTARTSLRRAKTNPKQKMRTTEAIATAGIITFGKEAQAMINAGSQADQDRAYLAVARAIGQHYKVGVHSLVVHCDETAPHAHFMLDARCEDGTPFTRANNGHVIQDIAARAIKEIFPSIERGVPKKTRQARGEPEANWVHRSVKELHEDLPKELAAKQKTIDVLDNEIAEKLVTQNSVSAHIRTMQTTISNLKEEEAAYNERKMSPGNLLTGGPRKMEKQLMAREQELDLRINSAEQAILERRTELEKQAAEELAAQRKTEKEEQKARLEQENLAIEAILKEVLVPDPKALPSRPKWSFVPNCDKDWLTEKRKSILLLPFPANVWRGLRTLANKVHSLALKITGLENELAAKKEIIAKNEAELENSVPASWKKKATCRLLEYGLAAGDLEKVKKAKEEGLEADILKEAAKWAHKNGKEDIADYLDPPSYPTPGMSYTPFGK